MISKFTMQNVPHSEMLKNESVNRINQRSDFTQKKKAYIFVFMNELIFFITM